MLLTKPCNNLSLIFSICFFICLLIPASGYSQVTSFNVNYSQVVGQIKNFQAMDAGPIAAPFSGANLFSQFIVTGMKRVRGHGLFRGPVSYPYYFSGDINCVFPDSLADPEAASSYNFLPLDSQIVAMISVNVIPYMTLGYSFGNPVKYVTASNRRKWAEICKHIIMHYNDGWASGFNYNIREWEIFNEPDISVFWTGTPAEYYALYDTTSRVLKTYNPNLSIAGPVVSDVVGSLSMFTGFLVYVKNNNVPFDICSYHCYCDTTNKDAFKVYRDSRLVQHLLDSLGLSVPQYMTEWNIGGGELYNNYHYNAGGAAFTVSVMTYLQNSNVALAIRYRSCEPTSEDSLGPGAWDINGTYKKPAYAFVATKKLFETPQRILCSGSDSLGYTAIAGRSVTGDTVTILISDLKTQTTGYNLTVTNLPWSNQEFLYKRYILDQNNNLSLSDSLLYPGNATFNIQNSMNTATVHLIRLMQANLTGIQKIGTEASSFHLSQNYPNPFNPSTKIKFSLPNPSKEGAMEVSLKIYDVLGRQVTTLVNEKLRSGTYEIEWNAGSFPSGVYFYKLEAGGFYQTKKLVLIK